jgi:hypothetical protein
VSAWRLRARAATVAVSASRRRSRGDGRYFGHEIPVTAQVTAMTAARPIAAARQPTALRLTRITESDAAGARPAQPKPGGARHRSHWPGRAPQSASLTGGRAPHTRYLPGQQTAQGMATSPCILRRQRQPSAGSRTAYPAELRKRAAALGSVAVTAGSPAIAAKLAPEGPVTWCFMRWQVLGSNQRRLCRRFYRPCPDGP